MGAFRDLILLRDTHLVSREMGKGTFEVIVETGTSRDNITRLANHEGWNIEVKEEGDEFILILSK